MHFDLTTRVLPKHVAIVMDGNGRWAKSRGLERCEGHKAGVAAMENVIRAVVSYKIPTLTLFAFSIDNWHRPNKEVCFLMDIFAKQLDLQLPHFIENNIRLRVLGDLESINSKFRDKILHAQDATEKNDCLTLVLAFNYSGRWEIVQAFKKLYHKVQTGSLKLHQIDYDAVHAATCLPDIPEPDLLIRTSGELRLSNFMLWQMAYTELYFTDLFWPDFDADALKKALHAFSMRQRRYGLVKG